ncbi:hypothetical protein DE146DRAFT_641871 [Phaeosphaeria sp. MPI-PUGE-AT-0046c]|nr:hypothetical protein DE146DRAFT_641871 [Phaeosphaeria sp. MPI-PUGE-AT-0046c]
MKTYNALSASLIHALEILRHDRNDRFSIREEVPFILLRLGQDQICYDFCVAWTNEEQMFLDPAVTYDFEDPAPFAIPSQNMMEMYEYRFDVGNTSYFPHAVAMVLLKLRLLLRIVSVPETRALNAVRTTVAEQLKTLCNSITGVVPDFWPKIIDEVKQSPEVPDDVVFDGLESQAVRTLVLSFAVWKESPGALELLEILINSRAPLPGTKGST